MDPQALLSPEALTGAIAFILALAAIHGAVKWLERRRRARLTAERARLTREAAALKPHDTRRAAKFKEATRLLHQELKLTVR